MGLKFKKQLGAQWLMPVILATQEAEIRRTATRSQLRQTVRETLMRKNPSQERAGGVAQGVGPEFKLYNHKKNSKESSQLSDVKQQRRVGSNQ
jgi:hypothetical protein